MRATNIQKIIQLSESLELTENDIRGYIDNQRYSEKIVTTKDADIVDLTGVYKAGIKYGAVALSDVYKAGSKYGTVSPVDLYKAGTMYAVISPNDVE